MSFSLFRVLCLLSAAPVFAALDPRATIARADLDYLTPATRSEEGMPVGNGRMGGLVWTSPSVLKFQINRVDVFAMHASSVRFPQLGSFIDTSGIGGAQIIRNRLRLREGPGAIDAEHLAGLSNGVHSSLLDGTPPEGEHGEPLLRVFPAWLKDWGAEFTLLARGAFTMAAAQTGGKSGRSRSCRTRGRPAGCKARGAGRWFS
jgi:hypothetical protein